MQVGQFTSSIGKLRGAMDDLHRAWSDLREHWADGTSNHFEEVHIRPALSATTNAADAASRLNEIVARARQACDPNLQ